MKIIEQESRLKIKMESTQKKGRTYRFLPAYILLFLEEKKLYGSALLNEFRRRLPNYSVDSAVIYRTLQELEKGGFLKSDWKTEDPGPATKWYEITDAGLLKLKDYKRQIEIRIQNLEFFLNTYRTLNGD